MPDKLPTVLENITAGRRAHLPEIQAQVADVDVDALPRSTRSLYDALRGAEEFRTVAGNAGRGRGNREGRHFIMECKSASPSLGMIRPSYDPSAIARIYSRYAVGISVLCEPDYFGGSYAHLAAVRANTHLPVLCKDFIVDRAQVIAARYYGADAILLMLSIVTDEEYTALSELAGSLGLDVITEVITEEEVARAARLGAKIFGINHRNLHDLSIDLSRSERLEALIPSDAVVISESGVRNHATVRELSSHSDGFLVGSQLTSQPDVDIAARELVHGPNKVCGLRTIAEAQLVRAAGAVYGGLIFEEASPRNVSRETASEIIRETPHLRFVAVSRRTTGWEELAGLGVCAVQIHAPYQGSVDAELALIESVRAEVPEGTEVWRAVSMTNADGPAVAEALAGQGIVDKLILDSGDGGTGQAFDWDAIPGSVKQISLLAGGITAATVRAAKDTGVLGVDLNSGLEYGTWDIDAPTPGAGGERTSTKEHPAATNWSGYKDPGQVVRALEEARLA